MAETCGLSCQHLHSESDLWYRRDMQRLYSGLWIHVSELVLVLIMLPVFRLIRDSCRVRLSEITTGLTGTKNHSVTSHFHFRFVSSCYSGACIANAAVVEKALICCFMSS